MSGELPPPCRAHTSTLVDRKLVVYGGGQGAHYYSDVFVLDTLARRWARADFGGGTVPAPRRAHTAEHYRGRIYVFGGGNGTEAVNDVWALDVGAHALPDRMRWDKLDVRGPRPCARGYHTANVVGDVMIIIGGSDGKECFMDVWCLHLGARHAQTARTARLTVRRQSTSRGRRSSSSSRTAGSRTRPRRSARTSTSSVGTTARATRTTSSSSTSVRAPLSHARFLLTLGAAATLQYEHRTAHGRKPSLRGYHVAFLADSRVFFVGGFNGHDVFDDVHCLELAAASYLPQVTSFLVDLEAAPIDDAPRKGRRG
jgi:hypothetical protein